MAEKLKKFNSETLAMYRKDLKYYMKSAFDNAMRSHGIRRVNSEDPIFFEEDGRARWGNPTDWKYVDIFIKATWVEGMVHDGDRMMHYVNAYQKALLDDKFQDIEWGLGITQEFNEARNRLDPDWLMREIRSNEE